MGAANCCKKPTEIIVEEIKYSEIEKEKEKDKINPLEQDSYPQDTVTNPKEENNQQEISNQKLYEQEIQPQFGEAYEVPINSSTPEQQYNQFQLYENNIQQQQNEFQSNESNQQQADLAQYNLIDPNMNVNQNLSNKFEIQRSDISNTGPIDIATLTSQRSAAPVNQLQNIANVQQITSNIPQTSSSQVPLKQAETQEEDLNKYFQIPPGQYTNINVLNKSKTSNPTEFNMDEIQKLLQQNQPQIQAQQQKENLASVTPMEQNEDINKYFQNIQSGENNNENANKEIPIELKHVDINVNESLPETFGTYNIQQLGLKPETNANIIKKEENVNGNNLTNLPQNLTAEQINKIIEMKDLPDTFGSNNINSMKQGTTTTTTTTKTTTQQNVNLTNLPDKLTSEQINQIIDMKDLPETFGSNNISNQKQTTITTTTTNVPTNIDIKVPNDINNLKQQITNTQNIDLSSLPSELTKDQINQIINMKDLPETLGSNTLNKNQVTKTTTVAQTSQGIPIDLKQFGLEQSQPNQATRTKTMPLAEEDYSKYFSQEGTTQQSSIPIDLNKLGIPDIIQGSNITFQNPSQSINASINNLVNTNSTPIVTSDFNSSNINPANQTNVAMSAINSPINYGLNNAQQKTVTTTTVTKMSGIPTGNTFTQSYTLPTNFTQNKVTTTTNVIKPGNNQNLVYSNTMPK